MLCALIDHYVCVAPWTWWMALQESEQAEWSSAVGAYFSAAAAFAAAITALWIALRRESLASEVRASETALKRRQQAIYLLPLLDAAVHTLDSAHNKLRQSLIHEYRTPSELSSWRIRALPEMMQVAGDAGTFPDSLAHDLLEFIAWCGVFNRTIEESAEQGKLIWPHDDYQASPAHIGDKLDTCARLVSSVHGIAETRLTRG